LTSGQWRGDDISYAGKRYQLTRPLNSLRALVADLQAQVAELAARVGRNSTLRTPGQQVLSASFGPGGAAGLVLSGGQGQVLAGPVRRLISARCSWTAAHPIHDGPR
jgi:hypothetical protein